MAINEIKSLITFGGALEGKLSDLKLRFSQDRDGVTSSYVPAASSRNGLNTDVNLYKVIRMINSDDKDRKAFVGSTANGGVAELQETAPDGATATQVAICEKNPKTGIIYFQAGVINANGVVEKYNTGNTPRKGTVLLLALMPVILSDSEASGIYKNLEALCRYDENDQIWEADPQQKEELGKALCRLTNNIYYRVKDGVNAGQYALDLELKNIKPVRLDALKKVKVIAPISKGNAPVIISAGVNGEKKTEKGAAKGLKGKYSILSKGRILTSTEKAMVPTMPDWYIPVKAIETEAKCMKMSTDLFKIPYRNLILYGPSGSGKTEGAAFLFSMLGLPSVVQACNVDMTTIDWYGGYYPNPDKYKNGETAEEILRKAGLPTFEDVEFDFANSYEKLFNVKPDEMSAKADCYKEIVDRLQNLNGGKSGESEFIYVPSPFVRAYRNGWGLEIQEPTIIKRPSVFADLNSALDTDPGRAHITLPTGEVVKRHPDFVCVVTTNQDYEGCRDIQQSVLSRFSVRRPMENPAVDELAERVAATTNFPDRISLKKMATLITKIEGFRKTEEISSGVSGNRELEAWAARAMMLCLMESEDGKIPKNIPDEVIVNAMMGTVIEKSSQVNEERRDIIVEVIQKEYPEATVMAAMDAFQAGEI